MAPRSKFKNAELILPCEWKECCFVGKCMEEFCKHIAEHLEEYLQHPLETAEQYWCWWRSCEFGVKYTRELVTRGHFHSYHTKLKFIGFQLRALHHGLPVCLQNSHSWHQLPKTLEEFVCHWENCDFPLNISAYRLCHSIYKRLPSITQCGFYQHVALRACATEEEAVTDQKKAVYCDWKEQILVCQNCQKHFANERLLRDHMRGHVNHVTCAHCDTVCTSVSSLKAHIRFRHHDERPLHCHLCDSSFKNTYDLHKHVETHNDSDAYSCDVEGCGFTSRTLRTLRQHYKRLKFQIYSNGILKYKCHICQKCFSWSYTLTLHLRKAHKLRSHSCFRYKDDDEGHMSLNLAVYNAVVGLDQARNNKMVTKKSSPSQNSFGREGGSSCKRDASTAEVLFTQLQPWSQATGDNVLIEAENIIYVF